MMALKRIALLLTIIGGINWGLVGAFKFNLVEFLFGFAPAVIPIIYIVVGISACYALFAYMIK
ncbi:MAG: DUF378 domain-containing protein [Alphaproteobacteria bacterium]|nr:DUF378 domain-containing protein [Alphaproteobacteria bacterium]